MMSSLVEVEQTKASLWPNSYQIVNSVSQEPFIQSLKIHYLVSYKVIYYNIKTCKGTKKIQYQNKNQEKITSAFIN